MVLSSGHCWTIQQGQKVVDFVIVPNPWKNNPKLMTDAKIMRPRQKQWSLLQELNCLTELQSKVFSFQFTGWWWLMMMMMMMKHTYGKKEWQYTYEKMNEMKWRVVDERTADVPSYNTFEHVNGKLGRQHTKAPLAAALSPFVSLPYPPNPWCEWCLKVDHNTGSTHPTLFEQWCGLFYVPQEPDRCKRCERGPTVFRPYPKRLESLTVGRCHYKGSTFYSVI